MNEHQSRRVAFFLNANAKSVTKTLLKDLKKLIPQEDLYFSADFPVAREKIAQILNKGYAYIFCGGGDGTVISAINLMHEYEKSHPKAKLPKIGVLGLGTGNALARFLQAHDPIEDIKAIVSGKPLRPIALSMIETYGGQMTPFAGVGYDGELINDFESVKEVFFDSPFRKVFSSVTGFTLAGLVKTLPRQIGRTLPTVRINSSHPAYRIINVNGVDEEVYIEQGELLYDDKAAIICVGTIPYVGYGITMFPFANKRPGYMHLRVSAVPISICLANLYPAIWHGHFRHKKLFDFLVKDVNIESEESLPYHIGGDAMGYRKQLYLKVADNPVLMASLYARDKKISLSSEPLLTPLI